jgi:hypothetical protein
MSTTSSQPASTVVPEDGLPRDVDVDVEKDAHGPVKPALPKVPDGGLYGWMAVVGSFLASV